MAASSAGPPPSFLAVKDHFDVLAGRAANRVDRRDERFDGTLVVSRRARVDAPVVGERIARGPVANFSGALLERAGAEHRRPGVGLLPTRLVDGLSVEVNVKEDGARGSGNEALAVDERGRWCIPHLRMHPAAVEHLPQQLRIPPDVRQIAAHVGDRHQLHQLANDRRLMLPDVGFNGRRLREQRRAARKRDPRGPQALHCHAATPDAPSSPRVGGDPIRRWRWPQSRRAVTQKSNARQPLPA